MLVCKESIRYSIKLEFLFYHSRRICVGILNCGRTKNVESENSKKKYEILKTKKG